MMAGVGAVTTGAGTDSPWRAVGIFVLLTTCLSATFWALINLTATVTAIYVFALMWMPGLAAILTCRILGRPLSTLGLGRWNGRFVLIAYLIPLAYCLVASVGTVAFGFGGFPNDGFVRTVADTMGLSGIPTWAVIVLFVLLQGTTGMVTGVGAAAGEEIGWRGFLVPELARVLPFTGVALLSGFIWAAWHYPITAVVYRDANLPPAFWLATFTFVAIAISFAQAWPGCDCGPAVCGRRSSCTPATTCGCSRSSSHSPASASTPSGWPVTSGWPSSWWPQWWRWRSGSSAATCLWMN